jgi:ribosomal protein S18 acetylase RimI-like enzyme
VGAAVFGPPSSCPLSEERKATLAEEVSVLPPLSRERFLAWRAAWTANDPSSEPHWHLGPFAVRADLRGKGIGTALLGAFLVRIDEAGDVAYLETDNERNARYYERHGFTTVGQAEVLGVCCWFMSRR